MAADCYTKKVRTWRAPRMFDFVNEFFFSKYWADSSESENPIEFFHPLVVAPEYKFKVQKMVKKCFFFCLLELLPQKNQKSAKMGLELKKLCGFFWLKSKTANTKKLKLDIQSYYKLGENFEWPFDPWW